MVKDVEDSDSNEVDKRPDYVHCIQKSEEGDEMMCGRPVNLNWRFIDMEHAALSVLRGHRYLVCGRCLEKVDGWGFSKHLMEHKGGVWYNAS